MKSRTCRWALLAGLSLGALFFGGLWWTVRQSMSAKHPSIWLFASLMLRMSATLTGFYFVGRGDWQRLVVCLVRVRTRAHHCVVGDDAAANAADNGRWAMHLSPDEVDPLAARNYSNSTQPLSSRGC